jgi:spore germination protein GerM
MSPARRWVRSLKPGPGPVSRRLVVGLTLVALAFGVAACGVPVGGGPSPIAPKAVPFDLLAPTPPNSAPASSSTQSGGHTLAVQVFLVNPSSHLTAVSRSVAFPNDPDALLVSLLRAVIAGPTSAEAAAGLQGAIPPQTAVLSGTTITAGLATVDLSAGFGQLAGQAQIEAIAQVVWTVTANLSGVSGVVFEIAGQPASVPEPSGALVSVATRADYASLAPS